jgi:hypothetical protein
MRPNPLPFAAEPNAAADVVVGLSEPSITLIENGPALGILLVEACHEDGDDSARTRARPSSESTAWTEKEQGGQGEACYWRSFKDYLLKGKREISRRWNIAGWPTVYVVDHRGVIQLKFGGKPEDIAPLDKLLDNLVKQAEAEPKGPTKR